MEVIRERGFYRASLEEIAKRAGMTRGAIYGNFASRDELFEAVIETRWRPIMPLKQGATLKEHMRIVAEAVVAAIPARRAQALGALSLQLYALAHEDARARIAVLNRELYRRSGGQLARSLPPGELPMPADEFVRVVHALTDGLLLLRFLQPDLITDDLILAAFDALA